jgi:hypothetical protein
MPSSPINANAGPNPIVPTQAGRRVRVFGYVLVSSAAETLQWQDGSGAALSGAMAPAVGTPLSASATATATISEPERLRLRDLVEAAFQKVPDSAWGAIVRRGLWWCVTPDLCTRPAVYAQFDAEAQQLIFYGPALLELTPEEIEAAVGHECAHVWLWAIGDRWWQDEHCCDLVAKSWGYPAHLLMAIPGLD